MQFLNSKYSLVPFLYFCAQGKEKKLLVFTNHPQRLELDFTPFTFETTFCIVDLLSQTAHIEQEGKSEICALDSLPFQQNDFDLIIVDIADVSFNVWVRNLQPMMKPEGGIIILDWTLSYRKTMRNILTNFGITRSKSYSVHKYDHDSNLRTIWNFIVDPGLSKPRHLVLPSFQTYIPAQSGSQWKNYLLKKGAFYLQKRHSVYLLSSAEQENTPIEFALQELKRRTNIEALKITRIYFSTSNVLLIQVNDGTKNYFIRFPFSALSEKRIRNGYRAIENLNAKGLKIAPLPVSQNQNNGVPYFIEAGLNGTSIENALLQLSKQVIHTIFRSTLDNIVQIHKSSGKVFTMDSGSFDRYVVKRVKSLRQNIDVASDQQANLNLVESYLYDHMIGKQFLASLCHGDFKIGNCLYDERYDLSGIIDWDMAQLKNISLMDFSNLYSNLLRNLYGLFVDTILFNFKDLTESFSAEYQNYFEATKTTPLPLLTVLLFNWLDRVQRQLDLNPETSDKWKQRYLSGVLKNIPSLLQ